MPKQALKPPLLPGVSANYAGMGSKAEVTVCREFIEERMDKGVPMTLIWRQLAEAGFVKTGYSRFVAQVRSMKSKAVSKPAPYTPGPIAPIANQSAPVKPQPTTTGPRIGRSLEPEKFVPNKRPDLKELV